MGLLEPDREFVLVDSNSKKVQFVLHAAGLLGLGNVEAVKARTEDFAPGYRFDTVIARAVASLPRLLEIAAHPRRAGRPPTTPDVRTPLWLVSRRPLPVFRKCALFWDPWLSLRVEEVCS